jgi:hypothetical protein
VAVTTGNHGIDDVLGYGGLGLAAVAFVSVVANPDIAGDPNVVPALAGILMIVWMGLATARHVSAHERGAGRTLMLTAWALLAGLLAFAIFQALDTAAFDDGIVDGLLDLAAAPPRLVLLVPLILASAAILRDRGTAVPTRTLPKAPPGATGSTS